MQDSSNCYPFLGKHSVRCFQVAGMSYKLEYTHDMMHYDDLIFFLGEQTEIEQWPDTFQSCSQFTASTL